MPMEIQNKKVGNKGLFYIEKDKKIVAEMIYTMPSADKLIIEHTEVSDSLKGQNIGLRLVKHAVEYARKNNLKIIPLCPFTLAMFKKRPEEYADVWLK
jgi:predicted GNAT family acetyltransferase